MKFLSKLVLAAGAIVLVGCDSDDTQSPIVPPDPSFFAQVQVFHFAPEIQKVNVNVDGAAAITGLDFGESGGADLENGTYEFSIDAAADDADPIEVVASFNVDLAEFTTYTAVAVQDAGGDLELLQLTQPRNAIPTGQFRVTLLHASGGVGTVDVYVTAPGVALDTVDPTATLAFGEFSDADAAADGNQPFELAAGTYQVRITLTGDPTVVFDSGPVDVDAGLDLIAAAVPNTSTVGTPVPIVLYVSNAFLSELAPDVDDEAGLRVYHAATDGGVVDIYLLEPGDDPETDTPVVLLEDVPFEGVLPALDAVTAIAADDYEIRVTVANDPASQLIPPIPEEGEATGAAVSLQGSTVTTAIAAGTAARETLTIIAAQDNVRPVPTLAKLRVIHASDVAQGDDGEGGIPDPAQTVDVYVVATGAGVTGDPVLSGVAFGDNSGFLQIAPGDYDVIVTANGETDPPLAGPVSVTLAAGDVITAVAIDDPDGDPPARLELIDDTP